MTVAKSIERLKRRVQHLTERINKARAKGKDLSFDRSERAALKRAIQLMEEYEYLKHELDDDELDDLYGESLGDQCFDRGWREDLALTEEERRMLN